VTAADKLYEELKHDIVTCALSPGASFSELELGDRYKTSRTPVREACRRLAGEKFITILRFRGYFVSPLTVAEFHNLQEMQLITDPAAAELAAGRACPEQVARMEKWGSYKYDNARLESYYEFLHQNRNLHVGIAAAAGNDCLTETVANIHTRLMRYFFLRLSADSFGDEIVGEHQAIIEAIKLGRREESGRVSREHILNTMRRSAGLLTDNRSGRAVELGPSVNFTNLMRI
jgi:DNA-binding GntR family transcriptional regulator